MIRLLVYGLIAYVGYNCFIKKEGDEVPNDSLLTNTEDETNLDLLTQPQQKYPFEKDYDPRVDNADQPWYVDSRSFMGREGLNFFSSAEERDSNVMSYNTNQFWQVMNAKYSVH